MTQTRNKSTLERYHDFLMVIRALDKLLYSELTGGYNGIGSSKDFIFEYAKELKDVREEWLTRIGEETYQTWLLEQKSQKKPSTAQLDVEDGMHIT